METTVKPGLHIIAGIATIAQKNSAFRTIVWISDRSERNDRDRYDRRDRTFSITVSIQLF